MANPKRPNFAASEVQGLVDAAKAGDIVARDELLFRFQRLASSLVNVCVTGRPNPFSSYQKTFLRMFSSASTPLLAVAQMLKANLKDYDAKELFITGQLAILEAIERCETNLASTIVVCFKDLIYKLIKDEKHISWADVDTASSITFDYNETINFDIFMDTLTEEEWIMVSNILDGKKVEVTDELREKVREYFEYEEQL